MFAFVARRFLVTIPTLLGVLTLAFVLIRVAPGDPASLLLGDDVARDAAMLAEARARLGVDRPLIEQYLTYLADAARGDLGASYRHGRAVMSDVAAQFPHTLLLTAAGVAFAVVIGLPAGIVAAMRRNEIVDYVATTLAMLAVASPSFWFAILLMYAFGYLWGMFPLFGAGRFDDPISILHHLALPAVAVGARSAALITRIARSAMLDVLGSDFVRTARAKGASPARVALRHALRNAAIPVVTVVGLDVAYLLSGTVIIETVFARPGLGKLVIDGVYARDYPVVQGGIVIFAVLVVLVNLLVDLTYAWIDPRVRYA